MFRFTTLLITALFTFVIVGCGSSKSIKRVDTDEVIDVSGNWNDTDSQQMANTLVNEMTTGTPWIESHVRNEGERPAIIVGIIDNKSPEHIPMKTLVADLEKEFINSGRVKVVASPEEREQVRTERADQQQHSATEYMARWGRERGADYMLLGELNAIFDMEGGEEVKYYQLDCYLVDLEDNTKVWVGDDRIKKHIKRSGYKP
jgi:PBP1b-binding outer membrane lipoprotein LpoB